ncbi:MAG: GYD domain-containing protein [Dehalococcoidia bacterium]
MGMYIILTSLSPQAFCDPGEMIQLAATVTGEIKRQCPGVRWKESFATLGRYDVVDVVESDEPEQVERAAMIIRGYGHARTETMMARPWKEFLDSL